MESELESNITFCESESDSEIEIDLILDKIVNRLTDFVRKQYCSYLEKLLIENYENWCIQTLGSFEKPPDAWIKRCVQIYEENAIKSCMIVQFYRQAMLRTMSKIRKSTINGKLARKVKNYSENPSTNSKQNVKYANIATQTYNLIQENLIDTTFANTPDSNKNIENKDKICKDLSLDEKLKIFRKRFIENDFSEDGKRKCSRIKQYDNTDLHNRSEVNKKTTSEFKENTKLTIFPQEENANFTSLEEQLDEIFEPKQDDIALELDKLFKEEQSELDEIFGNANQIEDPKIDNILREIEAASIPIQKTTLNENNDNEHETEKSIESSQLDKSKQEPKHEEILRNSLWPCELHMRKQKLQELLWKIGEEFGMRCHENLKIKFLALFGEDDEDEFSVYSPTIELDETLLSSCKKRISPWIVKYLMVPMKDGKILDRIVFKKFAKRIAHKIILENQYPSEIYVKTSIEHYFLINGAVMSIEEIKI